MFIYVKHSIFNRNKIKARFNLFGKLRKINKSSMRFKDGMIDYTIIGTPQDIIIYVESIMIRSYIGSFSYMRNGIIETGFVDWLSVKNFMIKYI